MKIKLLSLMATMTLLFFVSTANAALNKINVESVSDFSTKNPSEVIDVKVLNDAKIGSYELQTGDIIHCKVLKVKPPRIGKRSATFIVSPDSYTSKEQTTVINEYFNGKYLRNVLTRKELAKIDKKKAGIKAVVKVGSYMASGVAPAISLAEGMILNEDGNRIKSGVKQVYNNSVFSYLQKGKDIELEPGEDFYLIFRPVKNKKTKTKDNEIEQVTEKPTEENIGITERTETVETAK